MKKGAGGRSRRRKVVRCKKGEKVEEEGGK